MIMKKNLLITITFICLAAFALMSSSGGRADAQTAGSTGAPGDSSSSCGNQYCHGVSSILVDLDIELTEMDGTMVQDNIEEGKTYIVKVRVNHTGGATPLAFGFQLVALNADGASVNNFMNPSSNAKIANANGRQYAEHNGPSNTNEFTVEWTAPELAATSITFYAAGNGVDGDGTTGGDGSNSTSLNFGLTSPTSNLIADKWGLKIFPNPVADQLNLEMANAMDGTCLLTVFDVLGKEIFSRNIDIHSTKEQIDVSFLPKGSYSLVLRNGNEKATAKFIKK